ncbi:MAG TPA: SRPBCC family protein [Longimicrobiales bacterium]
MVSTYPLVMDGEAHVRREEDTNEGPNLGRAERLVSVLGGSVLALYGLKRRGSLGTIAAAAGTLLIERGVSGHSRVYDRIGISTEGGRLHAGSAEVDPESAMRVRRAVTVMRSRAECYRAWRDFSQLPRFMDFLESVEVIDGTRSHWRAQGPAGLDVEWDAEIVHDEPDREIRWQSVEPADVPNRGSVEFRDAPGDRGTEVHVQLEWDPPGGRLAKAAALLFGRDPQHGVNNALRRFRQIMETGTTPTIEGQSSGRGRDQAMRRLQ